MAAAALLETSCSQNPASSPDEPVGPPTFSNVTLVAEPRYPTPDSFDVGQFVTQGSCLILRTSYGKNYSPVLPFGSRFERSAQGKVTIIINKARLDEGQSATIKGGTGQYGRPKPTSDECPKEQYIVGGINDLEA